MYVKTPETAALLTRTRILLNLSLEDLAHYLQIGGRTVRRWEAGASQIPTQAFDELVRLCEAAQQVEDELMALALAHLTLGPMTDDESFGAAWPQFEDRIMARTFWAVADRVGRRTGMTIGRARYYVHPDDEGRADPLAATVTSDLGVGVY